MKFNVILHFPGWFPNNNSLNGIFIKRLIELLRTSDKFNHFIVIKNEVSAFRYLLLWFRPKITKDNYIILPENSGRVLKIINSILKDYFSPINYHKRIFKFLRPSLLHIHITPIYGPQIIPLANEFRIPTIISEHMGPFPFEMYKEKLKYFIIDPIAMSDVIVSVSRAQAEQIFEITNKRAVVIPNVVDNEIFLVPKLNFSEKVDSKVIKLINIGIYDEVKGTERLIEVFSEVLKSVSNVELHFVGTCNNERFSKITKQLLKHGVTEKTVFHGQLDTISIAELLNICDLYICSSYWESFGISILEALYSGLPVFSSDCGGPLDMLNEDNSVIFKNELSVIEISNLLRDMISNLNYFDNRKISMKARKYFDKNAIKEKYESIYEEITIKC